MLQAKALYRDLKEKDLRIKNCEAYDDPDFEQDLKERVINKLDEIDRDLYERSGEYMENLKMMVVVALIYEITRSLDEQEKVAVREHFERVRDEKSPPFSRE